MSVFSNPQGRPARVRALLGLLGEFPDGLTYPQLESWLTPGPLKHLRGEDDGADLPGTRRNPRIEQTIGVARALDLITEQDDRYFLADGISAPLVRSDFDGLLHGRFVVATDPSTRGLLAVYAYYVARTALEKGTSWISMSNKDLCDNITATFSKAGEDYAAITFNTTRVAHFKDWASFLGLGYDGLSGGKDKFFPDAAIRCSREIASLAASLGTAKPVPAAEFRSALAKRCPYLDAGIDYMALAKALGVSPDPTFVSPVTAFSLRELEIEGKILITDSADAAGALRLYGDEGDRGFRAISAITILPSTPGRGEALP